MVAPLGVVKAWSVTCKLHAVDGDRCNKSLNMGEVFTSDEARCRIKEWCLRGLMSGSKAAHMAINPHLFTEAALDKAAEEVEGMR